MTYRINIFDPKKLGLQRIISEALTERGMAHKHVYSTILVPDGEKTDIVDTVGFAIGGRKFGEYHVGGRTSMDGKPCWYYHTEPTPARVLKGWVNIQRVEAEISLKVNTKY